MNTPTANRSPAHGLYRSARRLTWVVFSGIAASTIATLGGCYAAPKHAGALKLDEPGGLTVHATKYWDSKDLPTSAFEAHPRVAIVEFSVEYVVEKRMGFMGTRPLADAGEISITGGVADLVGFGRERLELSEDLMAQLPVAIQQQFERRLTAAGFDVLPTATIASSDAYAKFETLKPGGGYPVLFLNPFGSDTGRPKEIQVFPASGLKILSNDTTTQRDQIRTILHETGADIGLAVRVRVGADDGFASLEQDSEIRVITSNTDQVPAGRLWAIRSILSDKPIKRDDGFRLFTGSVTKADPALFRDEVTRVSGNFLGMAISTLRGGDIRSAAGMLNAEPKDAGASDR